MKGVTLYNKSNAGTLKKAPAFQIFNKKSSTSPFDVYVI